MTSAGCRAAKEGTAIGTPEGRSGVGLIGFAVIALFLVIVVIAVSLTVGRALGQAEASLQQLPGAAASQTDR